MKIGHLPCHQFSGLMLVLGIVSVFFPGKKPPKVCWRCWLFGGNRILDFRRDLKFGSTHSKSKIRESLQVKEKYLRIRRARGFLRPACSVPAWSKSLNTLNCSLKKLIKNLPKKKDMLKTTLRFPSCFIQPSSPEESWFPWRACPHHRVAWPGIHNTVPSDKNNGDTRIPTWMIIPFKLATAIYRPFI